jgi:hypothetical protein
MTTFSTQGIIGKICNQEVKVVEKTEANNAESVTTSDDNIFKVMRSVKPHVHTYMFCPYVISLHLTS